MYELGMLVEAVLIVITWVNFVFEYNSIAAENYKKIGRTLALTSGTFRDMTSSDLNRPIWLKALRVGLILVLNFLSLFLSWAAVAWYIYFFSNQIFSRLMLPNSVKESRWRIRHINLSKEEMVTELLQIAGRYSDENLAAGLREIDEHLNYLHGKHKDAA